MPEYQSKFIDVDGIRTHYLEAGSGPLLILVHGGGAGASADGNWRESIPLYAGNFLTVAPDMVGFGSTDKPDPANFTYSQQSRNDHLAAFIRALGLGPAAVMGTSMGGATCLGVAIQYPDLVTKLILTASAGIRPPARPGAAMSALREYDFTVDGMRRMLQGLIGSRFVLDEDEVKHRHQFSIEPSTRVAYEHIVAWGKANGGYHYPEEQIAEVTVPALIVAGKEDKVFPLSNCFKFLELLPNSWGYVIPGVGHWAMKESPRDFVAATTQFLLAH